MKTLLITLSLFCGAGATAQLRTEPDANAFEKYQKEITRYNKKHDSLTAEFYYKRGGIRQDYLYMEDAIADYTKAIEKGPENPKAYYNRGLAKLDLDRYQDAIVDFDKALELDPGKIFALNNRGIAKYYILDYDGAMKDYNAAIAIDPNFAEAYNNLGLVLIKQGKEEDGCLQFNKAYKLGDKASLKNIEKYCNN
jgi:tetratricopeptide (TPR) repeat protein